MSDRLAVFFDPRIFDHDTGRGFFEAAASPHLQVLETHPENADRLRNMCAIISKGPISDAIDWLQGEPAAQDDLERFHLAEYIDELASIPVDETRWFSGTTVFGPGSYDVCCRAAGQAIAAAQHMYSGKSDIACALVRPPGHHAQPGMADGYCFFNNIGVAIESLRARGLKSAAVIDWDVHHGNGTQEGYYADSDVLTVSLHMPHGAWGETHPQTGSIEESGTEAGRGKNMNLPMPYGSGDKAYLRVFDEIISPAIRAHQPEILVIANGQDANQFDPNGRMLLSMHGFHELGRRARLLADECCEGRLLLVQEGGYAISYAAYCLHATIEGVLLRKPALADPLAYMVEDTDTIDGLIAQWRNHFSSLSRS